MKKFIIGIIISTIFIILLVNKLDVNEFLKVWEKAKLEYLIPIFFFQIFGMIFFSARWYLFLEKKLKLKHCISSTFIGYAANNVLPARGGDLLRVFYARSETDVPYFSLLSKLFIEKIIDFLFVLLVGLSSLYFINIQGENKYSIFIISGFISAGVLISLYLVRFHNTLIRSILKKIFSIIKKEEFYVQHIDSHLIDLELFLHTKMFIKPGMITMLMWSMYFSVYIFTGLMLDLNLNLAEIIFILFCGAMSLAVPSAPSGIGVFHASVVSAFILMGKNSSDGLMFATISHLTSFIIITIFGLIFYLYWTYRRRSGYKKEKI